MKRIITILSCLLVFTAVHSQSPLYDPSEDAESELRTRQILAKQANLRILVQVGGNWCAPCFRFNSFLHDNRDLISFINKHYILYHLNYSPENRNEAILTRYNSPEKHGVPVLLVLDEKGNLLHTQEIIGLVGNNGYDMDKTMLFLEKWKPSVKPAGSNE